MNYYHIVLGLNPEQVKRLRVQAALKDKSVKDFVTDLVVSSIDGVKMPDTNWENTEKAKASKNKKEEN